MAVDLNNMASNIKSILSGVNGVVSAFDHEPQDLNALPAVTLYFDSFTQTEVTMSRFGINWKWTVRVYTDINTSDIQASQINLRNLITNILIKLRNNITLNNTCLYHTIENGDVFTILNVSRPMICAELTLSAYTEENRE